MGFFSGIRRRVKKLIPKEIRPAIPLLAAAILPGMAGPLEVLASAAFKKQSLVLKGLVMMKQI